MSIFRIAWRSIQQRGVASCLTIFSMALGIALVVLVLTINGVVAESFRSNSTLGYHMIVGARGGALQLTLNSVFYLSKPVENIPYEYYLAFRNADQRRPELENSIAYRAHEAAHDSIDLLAVGGIGIGGGWSQLATELVAEEERLRAEARLELDQDGMFSSITELAIPLCLGDYFGQYRVVGTTPELFNNLVFDYERNRTYEFSQGRNFETFNEENGYFECVVGSIVAKRKGVNIGDVINPTHGAPDAKVHDRGFRVVGILASSGTPNDRAVFVNIEGFYLMENHAKPIVESTDEGGSVEEGSDEEWKEFLRLDPRKQPNENTSEPGTASPLEFRWVGHQEAPAGQKAYHKEVGDIGAAAQIRNVSFRPGPMDGDSDHDGDFDFFGPDVDWSQVEPLPIEQREVTSILVLAMDELTGGDMAAMSISGDVNSGILEQTLGWSSYRPTLAQKAAQGVQPIDEIERLFQAVVAPVEIMLLALTVMICIVSGISILVSIYNSMNERRHEIAVMRALGANRETIMMIVFSESVMISLIGGVVGWLAAHTVIAAIGPMIELQTGVSVGFLSFVTAELWVLPGVLGLAMLVGIWPAISAYFTDVSQSLGK